MRRLLLRAGRAREIASVPTSDTASCTASDVARCSPPPLAGRCPTHTRRLRHRHCALIESTITSCSVFSCQYLSDCVHRHEEEKSEELEERVDLKRVIVSPLAETLPDNCRDKTEEFYMDKYIRPYLLQFPDKVLRIRTLFVIDLCNDGFLSIVGYCFACKSLIRILVDEVIQICDIEWKLMALHPPSGVVNRHTTICCRLPALSALETLQQVNILPTQSTLRGVRNNRRRCLGEN